MKSEKLYKYYRFDPEEHWTFPINLHGLYFDSFEHFNDPHECFFNVTTEGSFEEKKEIIRGWNSSSEFQNELDACADEKGLRRFYVELNTEFAYQNMRRSLEKIRVTCFSKSPDILLMWSHYTKSHSGFCIEFDKQEIGKDIQWVDVEYVKDPPSMSIFKKYSVEWYFQHKYHGWSYEEEVRAIGTAERKYFLLESMTGICLGLNALATENKRNLSKLKLLIEDFAPHLKTKLKIARRHKSEFKIELVDYSFESLEVASRE